MKFREMQRIVDAMFVPDENGKPREHYGAVDAVNLPPLVAAYVGDAYFNLYVRTRLLSFEQHTVHILNRFCAEIVSAVRQAQAYRALEPMLTDAEKSAYRRGRNADAHAPRAASVGEYRSSTGFEAMLGMLYLQGDIERLDLLCEESFQVVARAMHADRIKARETKREGKNAT